MVWYALGNAMAGGSVKIGVKVYTKQQCFIEAVQEMPELKDGWDRLAETMTRSQIVSINGKRYTKAQCYAQSKVLLTSYS